MTSWIKRRSRLALLAAAVAAFLAVLALEITTDPEPVAIADLVVDALVLLLTIASAAATALVALRVERQAAERRVLVDELDHARRDGEAWRHKVETHMGGLRAALEEQFGRWALTPAERDIALLVLRGLSLKDIATLRATSEVTVRQQAQGIYRKSGLAGRAALTSYFLDDLFEAPEDVTLPTGHRPTDDGSSASPRA